MIGAIREGRVDLSKTKVEKAEAQVDSTETSDNSNESVFYLMNKK